MNYPVYDIVYDIRDYVQILNINIDDDDGGRAGYVEYDSSDGNEWVFLLITDPAKSIRHLSQSFLTPKRFRFLKILPTAFVLCLGPH